MPDAGLAALLSEGAELQLASFDDEAWRLGCALGERQRGRGLRTSSP